MRRPRWLIAILLLATPAAARAQFVTSGANLEGDAQQIVEDTRWTGRVSLGGVYYTEAADDDGPAASPQDLLYSDLRARVEAEHIKGGRWDGLGDLRLRFADDARSARGWVGGNELDLRELYFARRGRSADVAVGRQIVREVDATTIDGVRVIYHPRGAWEFGAFAGMFPNPFSRDFATDYATSDLERRTITDYPAATGAWGAYRYRFVYGSIGAGAILPRDAEPSDDDPARIFVTSNGYWRLAQGLSVFHYGVYDVTGGAGAQLMNLQVMVHYRPRPRLLLEAGASHMGTYALELYVRDLLEQPDLVPGRTQTNLVLLRVGSDEARAGATYSIVEKRVDVFGQVRYRRRESLVDADAAAMLPPAILNLQPDEQWDISAGVRQRESLAGWTLGANAAVIRGDRTDTTFLVARGQRSLLKGRLDLDLDLAYVAYDDTCPANTPMVTDPTCTGNSSGTTLRGGASVIWRRDRHWLVLGDYHYAMNDATVGTTVQPGIDSHTLFLRAQYSF